MLQWDLSDTPLARENSSVAVPSEGELLVLMVGLLLLEGLAYRDLRNRTLRLTHENIDGVAEVIEERLPTLCPDIGSGDRLRRRLEQFVGIKVTRLV